MTRLSSVIITSVIALVLLNISGCITPDDGTSVPTPTAMLTPTPNTAATPEPTPNTTATPEPTPTPNTTNDTDSIYDNHSASWLYSQGYYGGGGGHGGHSTPPDPIPESTTFCYTMIGIFGVCLLSGRKLGDG